MNTSKCDKWKITCPLLRCCRGRGMFDNIIWVAL
jgi:hypothetical protein